MRGKKRCCCCRCCYSTVKSSTILSNPKCLFAAFFVLASFTFRFFTSFFCDFWHAVCVLTRENSQYEHTAATKPHKNHIFSSFVIINIIVCHLQLVLSPNILSVALLYNDNRCAKPQRTHTLALIPRDVWMKWN